MKKIFPFISTAIVIALGTAGCATENITPHMPPVPEQWATDVDDAADTEQTDSLKTWWKLFHDEKLDWLIDQTLSGSPDIKQAAAHIDEARGMQKTAFAELFPTVSANADYARSRSLFIAPITANTHDASFDASYELDVFGKNRNASDAADTAVLAATKDADWIRLSLIAEVARDYISMRAAEKQIDLAKANLATEKSTLKLVKQQHAAGGASEFDVERGEVLLSQSDARITEYERQKDTSLLALVTLTGLTAEQIQENLTASAKIPGVDLTPIANTPAEVLAQRPDIAAANLRFSQATSLKESQAAAIFPSISISGLYGISKTAIVDSSTVWSLGPTAAVNLLDFGRIQGQINAASAREVEAYEAWRKAVLQGLQDVETALTNVAHIHEQAISLQHAKNHAANAVSLAKVRYKEGDAAFLDVLDAQRQMIDADSALIDAESNYVTSLIALYKALGQY